MKLFLRRLFSNQATRISLHLFKKTNVFLMLVALILITVSQIKPSNHVDDITITIIETSQTNTIQKSLGSLLEWNSNEFKKDSFNVSTALAHNFALLSHSTSNSSIIPIWTHYTDFSQSSTAFFQLVSNQIAPFKNIFKTKYSIKQQLKLSKYEILMFPWLHSSIKKLQSSFKARGIVLTSGTKHFPYAFLLVKTLRLVLNCTLPIELIYGNKADLSLEYRTAIQQFENVKCIDLSTLINFDHLNGVKSWWLKAFAVLMSTFAEPIFIDADALLFVDPESLYQHIQYKRYGALFYHDRIVATGTADRFQSLFSFPSDTLKASTIYSGESGHEAESGVMIYDKRNTKAFFALLTTCNLNRSPMQEIVASVFLGDKETFWMGFELLGIDYGFDQQYGGVLGSRSGNQLCGNLAHSNEMGELIWFNGGLSVNRDDMADDIIDFDEYTTDTRGFTQKQWEWISGNEWFCWTSREEEFRKIPRAVKGLLKKYVVFYKQVRKQIFTVE